MTFTGSSAVVGKEATAAAAKITGVLLELGGKTANIIFDDANLDAACNGVLAGCPPPPGRPAWPGRGCWSAGACTTRWWRAIADRARAIRLGDPRTAATEMGPVATGRSTGRCCRSWSPRPAEGATVAAGGQADDSLGGYFVQPTVLTGVSPG